MKKALKLRNLEITFSIEESLYTESSLPAAFAGDLDLAASSNLEPERWGGCLTNYRGRKIKLIIIVAYGACWVCLCCHNPPNSDMDYRIFIVRTHVNACDCTWGCPDTER